MGYKVDYDALDDLTKDIDKQYTQWSEELGALQDNFQVLIDTSNMSGSAATNIKKYIETIHKTLITSIANLGYAHMQNCMLYKKDYQVNIDTGLRVCIESSELTDFKGRIEATRVTAVGIDDSLGFVLRGINDIFTVKYDDITDVDRKHTWACTYLTELDEAIVALEKRHFENDFKNTSELISSLKNFINEQLNCDRSYKTDFNINMLKSSEGFGKLYGSLVKVTDEVQDKEMQYNAARKLEEQRVKDLEESREWIKWVAVGVAVVGSIALIVVTAGGAGPVVAGICGAVGGVTSAAADNFADNYIKTGSLTEDMDWSEMGKDCLIGGVTGFISGSAGAAAKMGSAVKQPIDAAISNAATSIAEKGAEGLINTGWEVGEALITGKPGGEVLSILEEGTEQTLKGMVVSGAEGFVGGYIGGSFDVDSSKKGYLRKTGEEFIESTGEAFAKNATDSLWDVGSAVLDPNSSKDIVTVLKEENVEFAKGFIGDSAKGAAESIVDNLGDTIKSDDSKVLGVVTDTITGGASEGLGGLTQGVATQSYEQALGEREYVDFEEIWDENLEGGTKILDGAAKGGIKSAAENYYEDEELAIKLKYKDTDKDGEVEIVKFGKYSVLKQDYDAAREVAGKGAYKDKTAQDILGLPKNTPISEKNVNVESVPIEDLVKSEYKGRKTTNVLKLDIKPELAKE